LQKQLTSLVARYNGVDPQDETILTIVDIHDMQQKIQTTLNGTEIFLGIVGAMTLVVAGVGVANVMFISVKRATREIGIRMAVGARAWQILWHYIVEALVTTFIGGVIGISLAALLVWAVKQIPIDNEIFQFFGKPMPVLSGLVMVVVIITLGITGLLAGFFPAWRAANVNPVEALRHE
jgi:putative ABC transport system permease protein